MEISNLRKEHLFVCLPSSTSLLVKPKHSGEIWLFNCFEGCQHALIRKRVRISQIKKIIITDISVDNVSGLLGLLSSLSLSTKTAKIDIYAPEGLNKYIWFGRKYSQTSFRCKICIHNVPEGLTFKRANLDCYLAMCNCGFSLVDCCLVFLEKPGPFNLQNTNKYRIPFGPLYGFFKSGKSFILPDGFVVNGRDFIYGRCLGNKIVFSYKNVRRHTVEAIKDSTYMLLNLSP